MEKKVPIIIQAEDPELIPCYATDLAAGADLRAYITESIILKPGESRLIPTGIRTEIPKGYEIQVRPRSGLAFKKGVTVLNTPGTVDADYRGEIGVILINHSEKGVEITPKMRIAQMVLAPVVQAEFKLADSLTATTRGEGGFGHTGTH